MVASRKGRDLSLEVVREQDDLVARYLKDGRKKHRNINCGHSVILLRAGFCSTQNSKEQMFHGKVFLFSTLIAQEHSSGNMAAEMHHMSLPSSV